MSSLASMPPQFDDSTRLRAGSAISWGAILAGAAVAISLSLILLTLGAGLGFAAVSPWENNGISASGFTIASAIWLVVMQWLSAAVGGYIAGRLRRRWLATHSNEVFFRDTAHGLVTWAVATLIVTGLLSGTMSGLLGGGTRVLSAVSEVGGQGMAMMKKSGDGRSGAANRPDDASSPGASYDLDKLLRRDAAHGPAGSEGRMDPRPEIVQIVAKSAMRGTVDDADRAYLAQLVAESTGASPADAQTRVDAFLQAANEAGVKAKAAADSARKAAATFALYTALSLLIGAFIASVAAAIGGRLRDDHL